MITVKIKQPKLPPFVKLADAEVGLLYRYTYYGTNLSNATTIIGIVAHKTNTLSPDKQFIPLAINKSPLTSCSDKVCDPWQMPDLELTLANDVTITIKNA